MAENQEYDPNRPHSAVLCCICFELCTRDKLEPVGDEPGMFWDVCKTCAAKEKSHGAVY